MAKTMPVPVETSSDSAYQWEFASQWSKAWKVIKWSGAALLTLAFLTVIGQGFLFYRLFDDVHPVLGYAFILLLAGLLLLLVGRPLASFLSMPVAAKPPHTPFDIENPDISLLSQRLKYDLKYLTMLKRNPLLVEDVASIEEGMVAGRALLARFAAADMTEAATIAADLEAFQKRHIEIHLKKLDAK
ncbi:MAG TPA: hypothetical protein DHU81_11565, partial [Hyphomonas sp.]|nr:hypothetical protein [Hyphomonas sp.]